MKSIKQTQKDLNQNKNIIQSSHYLIVNPGLTHFNFEQVITHQQLLKFLQNNSIDTIHFLPHLN